MKNKWVRSTYDINLILQGDGFYISYNPSPCLGLSMFESDNSSDETALVVGDKFYILNGDFRAGYGDRVEQGLNAAMDYYNIYKDAYNSSWSN